MVELGRLVAHLNDFLLVKIFEESAINGLQISGKKQVQRVAFAVDGVYETFKLARQQGADLMIVHHGLYWGFQWALRGPDYQRVKLLMDSEIALYAAHLPLDAHRQVGHAANLLLRVGADPSSLLPFGSYRGQTIGFSAVRPQLKRTEMDGLLESVLGGPVQTLPFGPNKVSRIACVTGQGADFGLLREAKNSQIHYYISGEANHPVYHFAKEHKLNIALGGHYRTEVFGLHALSNYLTETFALDCFFIDVPTGM